MGKKTHEYPYLCPASCPLDAGMPPVWAQRPAHPWMPGGPARPHPRTTPARRGADLEGGGRVVVKAF